MSDVIVDVHCHPLLPGFRAALAGESGSLGGMPLPEWTYESQFEVMDANGIAASVASSPGAPNAFAGPGGAAKTRKLNEELAAYVARNPKRLGAFAVVPMDDMDAALEEMAYALDVLKLDGVFADTHLRGRYLGDAAYEPWFDEMNRRGATLFVHPATPPGFDQSVTKANVSTLEFMFDSTRMVTNLVLSGTRKRFPDIAIIATHGGGTIPYLAPRIVTAGVFPWAFPGAPTMQAEDIQAGLASFHFDLTAATSRAQLDALRQLVPPSQLLMGFDYPLMPPQTIAPSLRAFAADAGFDGAAKAGIMNGNARRLLPRLA